MARVEGWERLLWEAIEEARAKPFVWGEHDCATWAFDVRRLLTGQDAASAWRGKYRNGKAAARFLRQGLKMATHSDLATSILGAPLASPLLAQRGDIVLLGDAFGVCVGSDCAYLSPEGLTFRPITETDLAWRV